MMPAKVVVLGMVVLVAVACRNRAGGGAALFGRLARACSLPCHALALCCAPPCPAGLSSRGPQHVDPLRRRRKPMRIPCRAP